MSPSGGSDGHVGTQEVGEMQEMRQQVGGHLESLALPWWPLDGWDFPP